MHDWIAVSHPWQYVMNFQPQDWDWKIFFFNHKEDSLFLPPSLCYSITPWTVACQAALSTGILQARILEWVAYSISRGSSQLRNQTGDSCIAGIFFTRWATQEDIGIYKDTVHGFKELDTTELLS